MIHIARDLRVVPIETLTPYEKNARTHSDEQIAQIVASIKRFGFTNPILLDGDRGIIAGHGRLLAAKKLGLKELPTIQLAHLSAEEKRAYIIADNKLALNSGWDADLLASEIASLGGVIEDFDTIGFSDAEISNILAGLEDLEQPAAPPPRSPTTAPEQSPPVVRVEGPPPAATEWVGMPEFRQEDKTAYRTIHVHFANDEHVRQFAAMVKQTITEKTRYLWYPNIEIETLADKAYVATQ